MKKSAQVVMLPTNEKAKFGDLILTPTYPQKLLIFEHQKCTEVSQHLYFLSDEEIKEGDWFIMNSCIVRQCKSTNNEPHTIPTVVDTTGGIHHVSVCKKIIATTDRSLEVVSKGINPVYEKLPQPSTSFIEKFVEEYNKGNVITEVMVEYKSIGAYANPKYDSDYQLKINPDNTIDINMPKDSWSREEMLNLLESAWNGGALYGSSKPNSHYFDKWIEENL